MIAEPNPSSSTRRRCIYIASLVLLIGGLIEINMENGLVQSSLLFNSSSFRGSEGIKSHELLNVAKGKMATQSSTFKNYGATLAIDGDVHTYSHTNDDKAWLLIDLGKMYRINSVNFVNRWCRNPNDSPGCLCRLSNARVSLLDGNRSVVVTRSIGDTCHMKEVAVEFDSECSTSNLTMTKKSSTTNSCLPSAAKVKIESTTTQQIQVFEIQVFSPRNTTWDEIQSRTLSPTKIQILEPTKRPTLAASNSLTKPESSKTATKRLFYSRLRGDRSGSAILDMIFCHAYSYHNNATYGGAIANNNTLIRSHEKLIRTLGLYLPIIPAVPSNKSTVVLGPEVYRQSGLDGKLFTADYLQYLRSQAQYMESDIDIAVHIRRGDVTPCNSKIGVAFRYLPNSYYLDLIKQHAKPNSRVVIYSAGRSFESLDIFQKMGYEVDLNGEVEGVWRAIVNAKVVIMSKSAFTYVPAMLCRGKLLYPGTFQIASLDSALPGWEKVNISLYDKEKVEMQEKLCIGRKSPSNSSDPENKAT